MQLTSRPMQLIARLALAGFVLFLLIAAGVQAIHLHGMAATPISAYLRGPHSGWLQGAYYLLAGSLVSLGICLWKVPAAARQGQRVGGALLLIAGCAVALVAYTYTPWPMPGDPGPAMRESIHVKCAFTAFLSVTVVMFMEIPRRWHGRGRVRMWIFALLVLAVELASLPGPQYTPGAYGALEKLAILGLVSWLAACAATFAGLAISRGAGGH